MKRFALALFFVASAARAESFTVIGTSGIELQSLSLGTASSDLFLDKLVVRARYGIRVEEGGQQFSSAVPIILKTAYLVRDGKGREYRFWVNAVEGDSRWIEIQRAEAPTRARGKGVFRESAFLINGEPTRAMSRKLVLKDDGTYSLEGVTGRYETLDGTVALEGQDQLRAGELSRDGEQIAFRYQRAGLTFTVVMTREKEPTSVAFR